MIRGIALGFAPSLDGSGQALDAPEISDAEYDRLFRELQVLGAVPRRRGAGGE